MFHRNSPKLTRRFTALGGVLASVAVVLTLGAGTAQAAADQPRMDCSNGGPSLHLPVAPKQGTFTRFAYRVDGGAWQYSPYLYYTEGAGGSFASYGTPAAEVTYHADGWATNLMAPAQPDTWQDLGSMGVFLPDFWTDVPAGATFEAYAVTTTDSDTYERWNYLGTCLKRGFWTHDGQGNIQIYSA